MRRFFALLARPIVWSTGALLFLLLALHVVCPLLGVEDDKRWIIELMVGAPLAVFLVGYWLRQYLLDRRLSMEMSAQAKKHASLQGPDALRDYKAFSEDFTRAFAQLNEACRESGQPGGAAALPWIMILGPSGVGKSTALERSGLRFTSLGRRLQGIGGTRNCTWWLASNAVFLDTAGRYAACDEDRDEWRAFLHLLRRRRRRPVDAVLLQIGIDEILNRSRAEVERAALQLRERLDELTNLLDAQIPVHMLVSKCDLLDGFMPFFSALDEEEKAQPWGFRLDTSVLLAQPLGDAFVQRFAELIRALTQRTTLRILGLSEPASRESALNFPAELAAAGATLRYFTETLFEPRARGERPWLCAVHLGSAVQTGQTLPSLRQQRSEELALTGARYAPGIGAGAAVTGDQPIFLRGVFGQVLRQAEQAARPSLARQQRLRLHQKLAIAAAMAACLGGSLYFGSRYTGTIRWLGLVEDSARRMYEGSGLPVDIARAKKEDLKTSLLAEIERENALRVLLDDAPSGLPTGPHHKASWLLRRRTEEQLLRRLETQMRLDLEQAAGRQGGTPGEDFSRGFEMLRLAYVLRGEGCSGTDPDQNRRSLAQYVLTHWQRVLGEQGGWLKLLSEESEDPLHPRSPKSQLRRSLEFYFEQEPEQLRTGTRLRFDDQLCSRAKAALKSGGDDAALVFNFRTSLSGLYENEPQLSPLSGKIFKEAGMERVFTKKGCAIFFGEEAGRGSRWWQCVLDEPLPKAPSNLGETYRLKYIEAWNHWLHELALSDAARSESAPVNGASLAAVIRVIDGLVKDNPALLPQVLQTVGQGRDAVRSAAKSRSDKSPWFGSCGKPVKKVNDWGTGAIAAIKTPSECKGVLGEVALFNEITSKPRADESDQDELGSVREDYQKYLAAAKTLRTTLNRIDKSTERNSEALKLVQSTMATAGDLWALNTARSEFISSLHGRLSGSGFELNDSGLNSALRDVEGMAWRALVLAAPKALNEQWKNQVLNKWQTLKGNQVRQLVPPEESCKQRTEFLRKDLGEFVTKSLAIAYDGNSLAQCSLKHMAAPFDQPMPVNEFACRKIRDALRVGEEITDCPKAIGPTGNVPKREIQNADVSPPSGNGNCAFTADEVFLDRGDKVFLCQQSTTICVETKAKSSQRAQLRIRWEGRTTPPSLLEKDSADELFANARNEGSSKIVLDLPRSVAPGRCEGFKIRFTLAPAGGGAGAMPKSADTRWQTVDLPASLL